MNAVLRAGAMGFALWVAIGSAETVAHEGHDGDETPPVENGAVGPPANPVDLRFTVIDQLMHVGTRAYKGPAAANAQLSHYGGDPAPGAVAGDQIAGFTLNTTAKNDGMAGNNTNRPIPWGYPVIETTAAMPGGGVAANPWVVANGFQGQEGAGNHYHEGAAVAFNAVGPHPHIEFFIYRLFQPNPGEGRAVLVGQSDLKHTYRAIPPATHHELAVPVEDSYNICHNQDQSFYGPVGEIDAATMAVAAHDHMGSPYAALGAGHWRDHGEPAFAGAGGIPADPGHPGAMVDFDGDGMADVMCVSGPMDNNIDHMLQAKLSLMMPAANTRWFLAGTYFVKDDINPANNTIWIEFEPHWDAARSQLTFTYPGASGVGISTIPKVIPEPGMLALAAIGAIILVLVGRLKMREYAAAENPPTPA